MASGADTIVALSSGALPSGVAVIRMSGARVRGLLAEMAGDLPPPRRATLRSLRDREGALLDRGLVLFFPGPQSFTGEDCAELHLHGGRATVEACLRALVAHGEVRLAEAGEFTRRAFLSGKLDLPQAEALADLVEAETEAERQLALFNAEGGQGKLYESWRGALLTLRAQLAASFDFADEGDVPGDVAAGVREEAGRLLAVIEGHIGRSHAAELVRDGFTVVLAGAPNVGKSSLLNALAGRDIAIVTPEAGTTRDPLETVVDVGGHKVRFVDTAGLRAPESLVEGIGIEKARKRIGEADLVVELIDAVDSTAPSLTGAEVWLTKADLLAAAVPRSLSVVSAEGLDAFLAWIAAKVSAAAPRARELLPTKLRHVRLLEACAEELSRAQQPGLPDELVDECLRRAADHLGRISGRVDVEDLLDVIFRSFCIGK